jgi:hypothetical protein
LFLLSRSTSLSQSGTFLNNYKTASNTTLNFNKGATYSNGFPQAAPAKINLKDINYEIIRAIFNDKETLMAEFKSSDYSNTIFLRRGQIIDILTTLIYPLMTKELANSILNLYCGFADLIEYSKFMNNLLKDIKVLSLERETKKNRPFSALVENSEYHSCLNEKATLSHKPSIKQGYLSLDFEILVMEDINKKMKRLEINPSEYFDKLLSYKQNKFETKISRIEFHKAFIAEGFKYLPEELDYIFYILDITGDERLDREEFTTAVKRVYRALNHVQEFIKKNNLTKQDICKKMNIDTKWNEQLDFVKFKTSKYFLK